MSEGNIKGRAHFKHNSAHYDGGEELAKLVVDGTICRACLWPQAERKTFYVGWTDVRWAAGLTSPFPAVLLSRTSLVSRYAPIGISQAE